MGRFIKPIQAMLMLVMLVSLIGPAGMLTSMGPSKVHPLLKQMASVDPERKVAVIVQILGDGAGLEAKVTQFGGEITKDLHIINAFAAELSAESTLELASDPGVRWVSLDAAVESAKKPTPTSLEEDPITVPENDYLDTLGVRDVWAMGLYGEGISVAVIDSGIFMDRDFSVTIKKPTSRIIWQESFSSNSFKTDDATGHGTHVAGIIGGHGGASDGLYSGVAPEVNLINLKVSDEDGVAFESDVVAAMQWVYDFKDQFNVRVVNLSLNSTVESSYHTSPMDAAAEILWFNGVVVIASAGNLGVENNYNTANAAPANDPFIITVGASDEMGTSDINDDKISSFSAYATTYDGVTKPDIVAPGKDIISVLANSSSWDMYYSERVVMEEEYFRLSGTSMAAPMVSGAVALLLQSEPDLTPDQVKYRLLHSGTTVNDGDRSYPYLNVYASVTGSTTESANTGQTASQLLWSGDNPVAWDSVAWNSVAWNSVAWNSVAWNSVAWNSVAWNSVAWNE